MTQLIGIMGTQTQHLERDTQIDIPLQTSVAPILVPLWAFSRRNKELEFHLFKFTRTEDEVAWSNFVAETFTDLSDTKRRLLTTRL